MVDEHIYIHTADMPLTRKHQIRDPATDNPDLIPIFVKKIYLFHKYPVRCCLLTFTIVKRVSQFLIADYFLISFAYTASAISSPLPFNCMQSRNTCSGDATML